MPAIGQNTKRYALKEAEFQTIGLLRNGGVQDGNRLEALITLMIMEILRYTQEPVIGSENHGTFVIVRFYTCIFKAFPFIWKTNF